MLLLIIIAGRSHRVLSCLFLHNSLTPCTAPHNNFMKTYYRVLFTLNLSELWNCRRPEAHKEIRYANNTSFKLLDCVVCMNYGNLNTLGTEVWTGGQNILFPWHCLGRAFLLSPFIADGGGQSRDIFMIDMPTQKRFLMFLFLFIYILLAAITGVLSVVPGQRNPRYLSTGSDRRQWATVQETSPGKVRLASFSRPGAWRAVADVWYKHIYLETSLK